MFWFWTISFYPFLLLHLAPLCSGGKGGAPTLLLIFPHLSISLCLCWRYSIWNMLPNTNCLSKVIHNYVGTINNNCVGGMAGYITGFIDNFAPGDVAAFISAEK